MIPQGFRHAATLLLINGARAIPPGASPDETRVALERLAHELVALAGDMHMTTAGASGWLIAEFNTTIDRLPQRFDREAAKSAGAVILACVPKRARQVEASDLFLIYAPQDRLPLAAPLAIELAKRRVSVAFADYEVSTAAELSAALEHGLMHHRGGVVLWTSHLEHAALTGPPAHERIRIFRQADLPAAVSGLIEWTRRLRVSKV